MNIDRSKYVLPKDIWEEQNHNFAEKEDEIALSHIDEQIENHIHVEKEIVSKPSEKYVATINKGSLIVEDGKHRGEVHLLKIVWDENLDQKVTSKDDPTEFGVHCLDEMFTKYGKEVELQREMP